MGWLWTLCGERVLRGRAAGNHRGFRREHRRGGRRRRGGRCIFVPRAGGGRGDPTAGARCLEFVYNVLHIGVQKLQRLSGAFGASLWGLSIVGTSADVDSKQ